VRKSFGAARDAVYHFTASLSPKSVFFNGTEATLAGFRYFGLASGLIA
jgi:hypothetical protein